MIDRKPWTTGETSYIYWLVVFGLSSKEIAGVLVAKLLPARTYDAVTSQTTEVRKFINEVAGQKLERPTKEKFKEFMRKVAKVPTPEVLLKYRPEVIKAIEPIRRVIQTGKKRDLNPTIEDKIPVVLVEVDSIPDPILDEEVQKTKKNDYSSILRPNILDVMRLAHDLEAKEVEYEGMKIKF